MTREINTPNPYTNIGSGTTPVIYTYDSTGTCTTVSNPNLGTSVTNTFLTVDLNN